MGCFVYQALQSAQANQITHSLADWAACTYGMKVKGRYPLEHPPTRLNFGCQNLMGPLFPVAELYADPMQPQIVQVVLKLLSMQSGSGDRGADACQ